MTALLAWVWAPFLLYFLCLGVGLLADAVLRTELPAGLLPPVGLALAIVLITPGYRLGLSANVAVPLLLVAAIVGFVLARRHLRDRLWAPHALIAAGAVYALYMAPVMLSGDATFAGYNFVNDTASNLNLTAYLEHSGATIPTDDFSATARNAAALLNLGYPLGSFSLLATLRPLSGVPLESMYQPAMSLFAALTAMSLTELARRSGLRAPSAVAAACLALCGVLLYRYVLHGAIKEIVLVALCATAAVLGVLALERRLPVRLIVLLVLTCVAMVLVFSAAAGAFALALGGAMLAAALLSPDRPSLRHIGRLVGVTAVVAVVVLLPVLGSTLDFADTIRRVFSSSDGISTAMFGQLVRPLPVTEAAGVWVARDYRYPSMYPEVNTPLVAASIVAALVGMGVSFYRRRFGPLLLLVMIALPALVLSPAASPYIDAKFLVILTPAVVFLGAFAALSGVEASRRPAQIVGVVGVLAVAAGVGLSDFFSYRDTRLAPLDRLEAMEEVAAHVPDRGLYLLNEWEEFGKYFMRSARVNPASEAESARRVRLRVDQGLPKYSPRRTAIFGRWFDLDEQTLRYVQNFDGITMRRSPTASRPPGSFRMIYQNDHYELWRQDSGVHVRRHLPLQDDDRADEVPSCTVVRRFARRARPGDRLLAARRPTVALLRPFRARRPPGWVPTPDVPGTVIPNSSGTMTGEITLGGARRVWLRATSGRPLTVLIDGREIGEVQQVNTPGQWLLVGNTRLSPGQHRIEVRRPGASWPPGDAIRGYVGPVALETMARPRLLSLPPGDAELLCGHRWDWIELVRARR